MNILNACFYVCWSFQAQYKKIEPFWKFFFFISSTTIPHNYISSYIDKIFYKIKVKYPTMIADKSRACTLGFNHNKEVLMICLNKEC